MWGRERVHEPGVTCSLVKSPDVYLETSARQKISYLMTEYTHQEWLAYLVGRKSNHENIFVEDISVPPHASANGASAEAEPLHIPANCVGVIHSHHTMGAFHSGTDQAYVDRNFPVSITVAKGREGGALVYDAVSLQKTPCGKSLTLKCTVKYVQPPPLFNKDEFLKGAKENIDKSKKATQGAFDYEDSIAALYGLRPFGSSPYVRMAYRPPFDITVDRQGRVLGQAEIKDNLARGGKGDGAK